MVKDILIHVDKECQINGIEKQCKIVNCMHFTVNFSNHKTNNSPILTIFIKFLISQSLGAKNRVNINFMAQPKSPRDIEFKN